MEITQIWTDSLFIELLNDINKEVWCCRSFSEMVAEGQLMHFLLN